MDGLPLPLLPPFVRLLALDSASFLPATLFGAFLADVGAYVLAGASFLGDDTREAVLSRSPSSLSSSASLTLSSPSSLVLSDAFLETEADLRMDPDLDLELAFGALSLKPANGPSSIGLLALSAWCLGFLAADDLKGGFVI